MLAACRRRKVRGVYSSKAVSTLLVSIASAGALLLSGCGSTTAASAPTAAASAAQASSAATAPSTAVASSSGAAQVDAVIAKWTCANEGGKVTCTCEGAEADCESTVNKPSMLKGSTGTVKWFNDAKGYGFITETSGTDIYVHFSDINVPGFKGLNAGQCVQFDVTSGSKGLQARGVTPC